MEFLLVVATWEVCTPYAHTEQGVTGQYYASVRYIVTYAARCMTRCVEHLYVRISKIERRAFADCWTYFW